MVKKMLTKSVKYRKTVKKMIDWHNKQTSKRSTGVFTFRTPLQAHMWVDEWTGQLSDGKYENSDVNWQWYNRLKVKVGKRTKLKPKRPDQVPTKGLRFTDLMWLFEDEEMEHEKKGRTNVRWVANKVKEEELKKQIKETESAIRKSKKLRKLM